MTSQRCVQNTREICLQLKNAEYFREISVNKIITKHEFLKINFNNKKGMM